MFACLQAFTEAYSEELQLNTTFNQFVSAYEDAYNGPNTLQHLLGVKNKYMREKSEYCVGSFKIYTKMVKYGSCLDQCMNLLHMEHANS